MYGHMTHSLNGLTLGVEQYDVFSQIISARVLKVANGPTEHISAISFVKN